MILTHALATSKTSLICDLAEVYHIMDWRKVPGRTLGALVAGLGPQTRIGMEQAGIKATPDHIILGRIFDAVNLLLYSKTKDAKTGKNMPESYADKFIINQDANKDEYEAFTDAEAYEKARKEILEGN